MEDGDSVVVDNATKIVISLFGGVTHYAAINSKDLERVFGCTYGSGRYSRRLRKLKRVLVEEHGLILKRKTHRDKYPIRNSSIES